MVKQKHRLSHRQRAYRRILRTGAVIPLFAAFLVVFLALAVFAVDGAYVQLVRTELRATTDAAAKAGAEALARNQDRDKAINAAIALAARNTVGGRSVILQHKDVIIGTSNYQTDGSWKFSPGGTKPNAVQIDAKFAKGSANGSITLFLAGILGHKDFALAHKATAASLELEICLAIDRSHSMCFDLTGVDWSYPPKTPTNPHPVAYPPHATLSRWAQLNDAVGLFLKSTADTYRPPRVGLVTWGSDIGKSSYEYSVTRQTAPAVSVDTSLKDSYEAITKVLSNRSQNVMLGGTHMSAGMDAAVTMLTAPDTRPYARKYMILMTDGQWNTGRDPVLAAQDAKRAGITIHTVTFLRQANQTTMKQVAEITGGQHFHADDGNQLREAFQELARTLPVVLTE